MNGGLENYCITYRAVIVISRLVSARKMELGERLYLQDGLARLPLNPLVSVQGTNPRVLLIARLCLCLSLSLSLLQEGVKLSVISSRSSA